MARECPCTTWATFLTAISVCVSVSLFVRVRFAAYRYPAAAVGILQTCDPDPAAKPIVCKHVVAFHAADMERVQEICNLDFNEEPMDQR